MVPLPSFSASLLPSLLHRPVHLHLPALTWPFGFRPFLGPMFFMSRICKGDSLIGFIQPKDAFPLDQVTTLVHPVGGWAGRIWHGSHCAPSDGFCTSCFGSLFLIYSFLFSILLSFCYTFWDISSLFWTVLLLNFYLVTIFSKLFERFFIVL